MVQMIENWSDVRGEIKSLSPSPSDPSSCLATVKVSGSDKVASFPNLLEKKVGNEITILVPHAAVQRAALAEGSRVRLRVRQGGLDRFFAHPDQVEKLGSQ